VFWHKCEVHLCMQSEQFQLHAQIEDRHWWFVARRRILRQLVHKVAPPSAIAMHEYRKRLLVVDIGCGTGANLAALADEYRCVGVDTSAEAIDLAHRRFPGITCICGSAPHDIAQWLRQAAVVLMTDVLEHVADDRGLLASIVEACSPGTQILLTVPADMRLWSPHDEAFGHYRRYDVEKLSAVWAGLPVKARLISHFNTRLYPLVRAVRSVSRWRGRTSGAANTDFSLPMRPINSVLEACFAGEGRRLLRAVDTGSGPYRRGVSLIAILQREMETKPSLNPRVGIVTPGGISDENQADLAASVISTPAVL
jgi:2-polyprenyl-3-methyl-5-hydroxy-6-metoxy-1,4-benzoquinol methylase